MLFASATTTTTTTPGTQNFLLPNGTFFVMLVIFLIVLGVISKWILPQLKDVEETRKVRIRSAMQKADESRAESQRLQEAREQVLSEARAQARSVIDDANHGADLEREQGRQLGQVEYDRLLEVSRQETEEECRRVRSELVGRLDSLVVAAAERVLGSRVDAERHRALSDEAVAVASERS